MSMAMGHHGHKNSSNIGPKSAGSALSPVAIGGMTGNPYDNFNVADYNYNNDFENYELNEEIKKLLLEN